MGKIIRQEIIDRLRALKPEILKEYNVSGLELFGSLAREEHGPESDIDILVDFTPDADMFDLVGLGLFLEDKLKVKVDIIPKRSLRPELKNTVLSEAVAL